MRLRDALRAEVGLAQVQLDVVLDARLQPVGPRERARHRGRPGAAVAVQRAHEPDDAVREVGILRIDAAVVQSRGDADEERPRDARQAPVATEAQRGALPDPLAIAEHRPGHGQREDLEAPRRLRHERARPVEARDVARAQPARPPRLRGEQRAAREHVDVQALRVVLGDVGLGAAHAVGVACDPEHLDRPEVVAEDPARERALDERSDAHRAQQPRGPRGPEGGAVRGGDLARVELDGHRRDTPSRMCAGQMPDLPGDRMPLGSSASLMRSLNRR